MLELEEFVWDLKSGFEILWANEYDKKACITYKENFKHKLYEQDIMSLDIEKLDKIDVDWQVDFLSAFFRSRIQKRF